MSVQVCSLASLVAIPALNQISPLRLGVWIGPSISDALAGRALLAQLAVHYPKADWVVFGPKDYLCLFEMNTRMSAYIPLKTMEARRVSQSRFGHWLEKRAQARKLPALGLQCIWAAGAGSVHPLYSQLARNCRLPCAAVWVDAPPGEWAAIESPLLDAGANALAHATRFYRGVNPTASKVLCVLGRANPLDAASLAVLKQSLAGAKASVVNQPGVHFTACVLVDTNAVSPLLLRRWGAELGSDCLLVGLAELLGLLAYADQVRVKDPDITRICCEMGRQKQLFVG